MHKRMIVLSALLLSVVLFSACGAAQTRTGTTAPTDASVSSVDHNAMATAAPEATAGGVAGMGHGSMPMGTATSAAPYDAQFIDSMIIHHQGAIGMANQALKEGQRQEIKDLAANIIKAQQAEIAQMREWRTQWYPDLADTGGMSMAMGDMSISTDTSKPFDRRFIEAMIPHHQSAIDMAKDAQQKAERQEIKTLAGNIITDQEKEIAQMQQWLKDWYGQ